MGRREGCSCAICSNDYPGRCPDCGLHGVGATKDKECAKALNHRLMCRTRANVRHYIAGHKK